MTPEMVRLKARVDRDGGSINVVIVEITDDEIMVESRPDGDLFVLSRPEFEAMYRGRPQ